MNTSDIRLVPLRPEHYPFLLPTLSEEEPFSKGLSMEQLSLVLSRSEGWAVMDGNAVIGAISLSAFRPLHSVMLNATITRAYHGSWLSLRVLRQVYEHLFSPDGLDLRKVYSYAIPWKTFDAAKLLTDMGFRVWGVDKAGGMAPDGECFDVVGYEMLREDCPWIRDKQGMREWMRNRRTENGNGHGNGGGSC